jgi:DNA integrity scanning protein DisA with diadenylate cyclase activity
MSGLVAWLSTSPLGQLGIADVVDILVVSLLVSALLGFMRRTQAGFVAIGLGLLGALYVAARAFSMELTAAILGAFFAVFLVIVVVIFQEELRQLFEQIATLSLRRLGRPAPAVAGQVDTLVGCLRDFARDRIGALVVLPGRQPLGRHVTGGVLCDAHLSLPLLKSIFDPHSPGHDGAVVLERGRVTRFAVHLPLSRSLEQLAGKGTRHSAALGLAERTDALCLAVSEERGEISAAEEGRLEVVTDVQVLRARIARATEAGTSSAGRRSWWSRPAAWRAMLRRNWRQPVGVLALVSALWVVVVPGGRPVEVTVAVPVALRGLGEQWELESVDPARVRVTFQGLRRAFYLFDGARLVVELDGSLVDVGRRTFSVGPDAVAFHPPDVRVQAVEPSAVRISVKRKASA